MEREKIDLGNSNYKLLSDKKRIIDNSNVEEVKEGTFGAWVVNGKSYLFGEGARSKKNTNKITESTNFTFCACLRFARHARRVASYKLPLTSIALFEVFIMIYSIWHCKE